MPHSEVPRVQQNIRGQVWESFLPQSHIQPNLCIVQTTRLMMSPWPSSLRFWPASGRRIPWSATYFGTNLGIQGREDFRTWRRPWWASSSASWSGLKWEVNEHNIRDDLLVLSITIITIGCKLLGLLRQRNPALQARYERGLHVLHHQQVTPPAPPRPTVSYQRSFLVSALLLSPFFVIF